MGLGMHFFSGVDWDILPGLGVFALDTYKLLLLLFFNISQAGGQNSPYQMKQHIPFREEYLSEVFQQHPRAGNSDF